METKFPCICLESKSPGLLGRNAASIHGLTPVPDLPGVLPRDRQQSAVPQPPAGQHQQPAQILAQTIQQHQHISSQSGWTTNKPSSPVYHFETSQLTEMKAYVGSSTSHLTTYNSISRWRGVHQEQKTIIIKAMRTQKQNPSKSEPIEFGLTNPHPGIDEETLEQLCPDAIEAYTGLLVKPDEVEGDNGIPEAFDYLSTLDSSPEVYAAAYEFLCTNRPAKPFSRAYSKPIQEQIQRA
ncbi:hypothetical protein KEM48_011593 [Puccinia striiformis f. sp. tritici PST-130]|nr:hypothetical protein KEM48_011593 [Puccinia striiformis f. sp. tritici PST-130]